MIYTQRDFILKSGRTDRDVVVFGCCGSRGSADEKVHLQEGGADDETHLHCLRYVNPKNPFYEMHDAPFIFMLLPLVHL